MVTQLFTLNESDELKPAAKIKRFDWKLQALKNVEIF